MIVYRDALTTIDVEWRSDGWHITEIVRGVEHAHDGPLPDGPSALRRADVWIVEARIRILMEW